jgi:peptide/nickel transport system substrate-binding protein
LKRILVFLSVMLVVAILLTSCSSSSTSTTKTTTAPQTSAATSSAAATTSAKPTGPTSTSSATTAQPSSTTTAPTSTGTAATKTPKSGGTFKFADPRGPSTTLGWFAESGAQGGMWTGPTFESMMEIDMNNNLLPMLATDWKVSDDLKTVTLTLRKGVKFHDGSDFNAAVAKWNFDQMIAAKVGVVYSYMTAVETPDDYTLKITLSQYNNTIINTIGGLNMMSKAAFDSKGKEWMRWNPVGTGAFKFVSFQRDVSIKMVKNTNYWRPGMPYLDSIEMFWVPDATTMVTAYIAGDYDSIGGDLLNTFAEQMKGSNFIRGYSGIFTLAPDSKNTDSPWSNLRVRQALNYAVDKNAIAKARGFGFWTPVNQFANPDTTAYNKNLPDRAFDPAKAKQLLADAGYPNGFSTKLLVDGTSSDKDAVTAIQANMNAVGIKTELNLLDFASYGNFRTKGWNNAVLAGMAGFFANHNQITDFYWAQTATFYPSVAKSDTLQQLHLASLNNKTYDPLLYHKVAQYEVDNEMMLPLWGSARMEAQKPYVQGSDFYKLSAWPGWRPYQTWLDK